MINRIKPSASAQPLSLLTRVQAARAQAIAASTARDHAARLRLVRPLVASFGAQEVISEAADFLAALDGDGGRAA